MKTLEQVIAEHPKSLSGVSAVPHGDYVRKRCPFPQSVRIDGRDGKKHILNVPCGKCLYCRERKAFEWYSRFVAEQSKSKYCYFVTLTYSDDHVRFLTIRDAQLFFKRLRSAGMKFRYSLIGEYGPRTVRAHYHILMFVDSFDGHDISTAELFKEVLTYYWKKGFVTTSLPTGNHMKYIAKYSSKMFVDTDTVRSCSLKPAIGSSEFMDHIMNCYLEDGEKVYKFTADGDVIVPTRLIQKYREDKKIFSDYSLTPVEYDRKLLERYRYDLERAYNSFVARKL